MTHLAMLHLDVEIEAVLGVGLGLTAFERAVEDLPSVYLHVVFQLVSCCPLQLANATLKVLFLIPMNISEVATQV